LGIAPDTLTKRLGEFVEAGIFELRPGDAGGHAEYVLTAKGPRPEAAHRCAHRMEWPPGGDLLRTGHMTVDSHAAPAEASVELIIQRPDSGRSLQV
jgi:hypothetical protein